jgi:hypothetical protein
VDYVPHYQCHPPKLWLPQQIQLVSYSIWFGVIFFSFGGEDFWGVKVGLISMISKN